MERKKTNAGTQAETAETSRGDEFWIGQIGIMLNGVTLDGTVVGGPAHRFPPFPVFPFLVGMALRISRPLRPDVVAAAD